MKLLISGRWLIPGDFRLEKLWKLLNNGTAGIPGDFRRNPVSAGHSGARTAARCEPKRDRWLRPTLQV